MQITLMEFSYIIIKLKIYLNILINGIKSLRLYDFYNDKSSHISLLKYQLQEFYKMYMRIINKTQAKKNGICFSL